MSTVLIGAASAKPADGWTLGQPPVVQAMHRFYGAPYVAWRMLEGTAITLRFAGDAYLVAASSSGGVYVYAGNRNALESRGA
jgi:hypothetical protein